MIDHKLTTRMCVFVCVCTREGAIMSMPEHSQQTLLHFAQSIMARESATSTAQTHAPHTQEHEGVNDGDARQYAEQIEVLTRENNEIKQAVCAMPLEAQFAVSRIRHCMCCGIL